MSRSRVLMLLALALALGGVASAQLSGIAGATPRTASLPGTACATVTAPAEPAPTSTATSSSPTPTPTAGSPTPTSSGGTMDTITNVSASVAVVSGGLQLFVTADSTTPMETMTALLSATGSSSQPLQLTMNPPALGAAAGQSTWTSGIITTSALPLGTYDVTVDAADQGGTSVTGVPAGSFIFPDGVSMSACLSEKTVTYGSKVTVSGTVTYEPGGAFVALPGQTVRIFAHPGAASPVEKVVTGANGRFTAVLPKEAASMDWVVQAGGPYLNTATVTLPMKVDLPTVLSGFHATLNQFWQVSFRACLALPGGVPGRISALSGLTIQYATAPGGPWRTLGTVPRQAGTACGNGGRAFSGKLSAQRNYAYYRARYAGGAGPAGTALLSSVSGEMLAWKYADRIVSLRVSPGSVAAGGKLTVSGVLQFYLAKWRNYGGQQVPIILLPKGSKQWYYWLVVPVTNSRGQFSLTFTDPVSATWSAEYQGNSTHLATVGAMIYVPVS
jgi:hypothetical protein